VRWSNFLEIPETSSIYGYSRLFSNWYRARQKLDATSMNSALHRISAKRVIIEIADTKNRNSQGRRNQKRMLVTGGVVIALVSVSSLLFFETNRVEVGRRELERETISSTSSPVACKNVAEYAGLEIADLREFDAGSWKIRTYSEARTLGSVWFVNFEAECSGQLADGLLTAQEIDGGYRILRMTPT
jgi:hypothetical protein